MSDMIQRYADIFNNKPYIRNNNVLTDKEYSPFDGAGIRVVLDIIYDEINKRKSVKILDYGCGHAIHWHDEKIIHNEVKKSLTSIIGDKLQCFYRYDPAHPLYSKLPLEKFDIVVCTDVMEHVLDSDLPTLLNNIKNSLEPNGVVIFSICTIPSRNRFIDGINMHVNIKSKEEWIDIIKQYCPNSRIICTQ